MAANKISAIDMKKAWYGNYLTEAPDVSSYDGVQALIGNLTEIMNIHQDTWELAEDEPSQDNYKDQRTGLVYRQSKKTMGDVTLSFTIGLYDYETKKAFLGGDSTDNSWTRSIDSVDLKMCLVGLTIDDQYVIFPYCGISAYESNTDGAIGISVKATAMTQGDFSSEYWYDATGEVA